MGQAESRQEQFWEACGFGHTDKVKQLLDEGIDVNWVSKTHDSCPIHAASQGKPKIVKLLIEAGCDVNVRDERLCTALHHAAMKGFTECAKLLLEAGAVVNVQDKNKWTPLHNSSYWAHPGVTELLLTHKADVSLMNKDDRLPLHEVARSKSDDEVSVGKVADLLIQGGCEIESRAGTDGFSDFTVLMFSAYHGHISVVRYLIDARCEVNAQSSNKWTALHWAADRGHADVVELLLENDADSNLLSERKEKARDRAKSDDVRAILDKFCGTIPLPTDKPKRHRTHSELSEDEMPDIKDFPQHLKPPSSNPSTPKSERVDVGAEGDIRLRCDTQTSSDSYQRAMANTPPSECATDLQSVADCTASLNGLVLATGEVINSPPQDNKGRTDEGRAELILQAEVTESEPSGSHSAPDLSSESGKPFPVNVTAESEKGKQQTASEQNSQPSLVTSEKVEEVREQRSQESNGASSNESSSRNTDGGSEEKAPGSKYSDGDDNKLVSTDDVVGESTAETASDEMEKAQQSADGEEDTLEVK